MQTVTQGEHGKEKAETGGRASQARECRSPRRCWGQGRTLPQRFGGAGLRQPLWRSEEIRVF